MRNTSIVPIKIYILIACLFVIKFDLLADHFVAGNFSYDCIDGQEIVLDLRIIIEEGTLSGATVDHNAPVYVFYKAFGSADYVNYAAIEIFAAERDTFNVPLSRTAYVQAKHRQNFSGFGSDGDYLFVYQRCCKSLGLSNLVSSDSVGTTLSFEVAYTGGSIFCNDTPELTDDALMIANVGETFNFQLPIEDTDGDSLAYQFGPLYLGGGPGQNLGVCDAALPHTFCPPPYGNPEYFPGYSANNPFGNDGQIDFNPTTGILSGKYENAHRYAFGIMVEEYRNGLLLGNSIFELQLEIQSLDPCVIDLFLETQEEVNLLGTYGCSSIKGDLTIFGNDITDLSPLSNIDSIYGSLTFDRTTNLTSISGFSTLRYIGKDLTLRQTEINSLALLSSLDHIGGGLSFIDNNGLNSLAPLPKMRKYDFVGISNTPLTSLEGLESVDSIREDLFVGQIGGDTPLITPDFNLKYVGDDLKFIDIPINDFAFMNRLKTIEGSLQIANIASLIDLNGFSQLERVGGTLQIAKYSGSSFGVESITGFQALREAGLLWISELDKLERINSFHQLTKTTGINFESMENLVSVEGFENLAVVEGAMKFKRIAFLDFPKFSALEEITDQFSIDLLENFTELSSFPKLQRVGSMHIKRNNNLTEINDFGQLIHVGDQLDINSNSSLAEISGFQLLESVGGFSFRGNVKLVSIDGFQNLRTISSGFYVRNNVLLENCDVFCPVLSSGGIGGFIRIENNGVTNQCKWPGICNLSILSGSVFFDENQNGLWDGQENQLQNTNHLITSTPAPRQNYFDGTTAEYALIVSPNTYELLTIQQSIWSVSNAPLLVEVPVSGESVKQNVGLIPNGVVPNAETFLVNNGVTRCNTITQMHLSVNNTGNTFFTGQAFFVKDPNTDLIATTPKADTIIGDSLYWNIDDLYPTQQISFLIDLELPSAEFLGDTLLFESKVFDVDKNLISDFDLSTIVTCSYDPNDKLTHPDRPGIENYTLFGEDLIYTIRFENVGNASAINVWILDELSTAHDLNTFEILQSSHPLTSFNLNIEKRSLRFFFNSIYLEAGKDANGEIIEDAANKGFVQFRIKPIDGLANYTVLENQAEIYFDGNEPVITNVAINTLVDEIPTGIPSFVNEDNPLGIRVKPNPSSSTFYLSAFQEFGGAKIEVFNMQGQKVYVTQADLSYASIPLTLPVAAGVYVVKVSHPDSEKNSILQIVKM